MKNFLCSISLWLASICVSSLPIQAAPAADATKPNLICIVIHEAALKWIRKHAKQPLFADQSNKPYYVVHRT